MREDYKNFDGFAVIDFETTGLYLDKGDRAVQVAIIRTDLQGNITSTWSHYINPERKMAAEHIHGISDAVAQASPPFHELVEGITHRIENRILVAHNLKFDGDFLTAEMNRAGVAFDYHNFPQFCTQQNAVYFLPQLRSHRLTSCLDEVGINFADGGTGKAHDAETDAVATAKLMKHFLDYDADLFFKLLTPAKNA